jgi:hypothetical protein
MCAIYMLRVLKTNYYVVVHKAFDMNFFEEIEDLKYKYAQAVAQNKRFESRYGRT